MHIEPVSYQNNTQPKQFVLVKDSFFTLQLLIVLTGAVFLYSNSSLLTLEKHLYKVFAGIIISQIIYMVPSSRLAKSIPVFTIIVILLNFLPQIKALQIANAGSPRWLNLGIMTFQPSELLKIAIICFVSYSFAKVKEGKVLVKNLIYPFFMTILALSSVILQKDFSTTALIILPITSIIIAIGAWFAIIVIAILLIGTTIVTFSYLGQSFRFERISNWLSGNGEQINQVKDTLSKGHLMGIGLGEETDKFSIPAQMTDFPMAAISSESGFIGVLFIIILFDIFAFKGFRLAISCRSPLSRYIMIGLTSSVFIQAMVNLSVTVGLLPVTGQPLPFFSVGGSSVIGNLIIFGIINNINRTTNLEKV